MLAVVLRGNRAADLRIQLCQRMTVEALNRVQSVVCAVFNEKSTTNTPVQFGDGDRSPTDSRRRLAAGFGSMELGQCGVDAVFNLGHRSTDGLVHRGLHRTGSTIQ